jgi:DinB family protein
VFKPVTAEQAVWRTEGSAANPIGVTFLHAYFSEDEAVHKLMGKASVFESGGWKERLRYDPEGWRIAGTPDCSAMLAYAEAVAPDTKEYLAALKPEDLEREIDTPRGKRPLALRLGVYLVFHKFQHMGDIAALLGCQGVKGLPF